MPHDPHRSLPPGPRAPSAWQLLRYSHSPLPFLEDCAARHGDPFTVRWAGYGTFVMLSDPRAVRDVFRGDAHALHAGEGNEFLSATVGPTSVLVLDGEPHARHRRLLLPPLKGERMRGFFDAVRSATEREAATWPVGAPVRMVEPMRRITLRVISQAVLGLDAGAPALPDFERKVARVLAFARTRHTLIWVKLVPSRLLAGTKWLPYFRQLRDLDDAILKHVAALRARPPAERGRSVLADLLAAAHEDGLPLTDGEIRDAVVTMLTAGHDTTALALAWALEQIVPRADVVEAIDDELRRAGGGVPAGGQPDGLTYLDAAIRESLRVRTILPFAVRLTKRPFVAGGREYPAGVVLCPCSHLVHRRPDLYPDPRAFRPERFLGRRFAGHEWFPFGGGSRACLGMGFALYEMRIVLATLLARLRLARPPASRSAAVRQGIALGPDDAAVMTVAERRR